ncbi:RimK family alpha-L-glutamate ligase [Natrialbaceae archaeon A-CW3]
MQERGFRVSAANWRDTTVEWSSFDGLLVRSCWEYYEEPTAFEEWLDTLEEHGVIVLNPPDVIRWNMHKFYLRDLADVGCPVPSTAYIEDDCGDELRTLLDRRGWFDAVVKPAVGTSSAGVWRVRTPVSTAEERRFRRQRTDGDVIVQKFVPDISSGECSLVFFRGEFSHASKTVPESGDFRAHHSYGSTAKPYTPSEKIISTARTILDAAMENLILDVADLLYARVDGVERDGEFILLELELIEPYLGLSAASGALDRFADEVSRVFTANKISEVSEI